jgi:hypothetical protein
MANPIIAALIAEKIAQSSGADRITDTEVRDVFNALNAFIADNISYNTAIPFTCMNGNMAAHTVAGAIAFTKNTTNAVPWASVGLRLTADGVNLPDFSAFKKANSSQDYDNTSGTINTILFWFDGTDYWHTIYQEVSIPALAAPENLTAITASDTEMDLSWDDTNTSPNEDGIEIQRSLDGLTGWTTIATEPTDDIDYQDSGLTASTQYFYRVRAKGDGVTTSDSPWSNIADDTTDATGGPEPETTAFVTYVEGTLGETVSPTEETALNDWFVTMKTGTNPLSKALAAYHVLGGTIGRKINSVNPDNTDAAKRIVPVVGCVIDGTGIETDGVDDYFTNNIIDGTDTPLADFAIAFHNSISRAGADSKFAFGTVSGSGATYSNLKNAAGNMNEGRIQQSGDTNFGANANTAGHYIFNHRIETPGTLNRRTVDVGATLLFDSAYDPSVQTPVSSAAKFAFGAFWSDGAGSALLFDNVKFAILVIFNAGLTDAEKTIVRTANEAFVTAMGR